MSLFWIVNIPYIVLYPTCFIVIIISFNKVSYIPSFLFLFMKTIPFKTLLFVNDVHKTSLTLRKKAHASQRYMQYMVGNSQTCFVLSITFYNIVTKNV